MAALTSETAVTSSEATYTSEQEQIMDWNLYVLFCTGDATGTGKMTLQRRNLNRILPSYNSGLDDVVSNKSIVAVIISCLKRAMAGRIERGKFYPIAASQAASSLLRSSTG